VSWKSRRGYRDLGDCLLVGKEEWHKFGIVREGGSFEREREKKRL